MNRSAIEQLVRCNAEACANALKPRCKCQCQRTLHRKPHSEEWIQSIVNWMMENQADAAKEADDE